jgi:MoaA/NifB/PqqE/SkfB family radical SAM enzyme
MPLNSLHFLLTYQCTESCDHCFLFGSPAAGHSFELATVCHLLDEGERLGTVDSIYFEGGEPFLHPDLLVASVAEVRKRGWSAGVVTNAFWARTPAEAEKWLRPLAALGLADLTVSDDQLHANTGLAANARAAAAPLGIPTGSIHVDAGRPGSVMYRGRAAEKLAAQVPGQHWTTFTHCPHEQLDDPERVHLDALGWVHLCQGLVLGNYRETPLADLVRAYDPAKHPIVGPLLAGGPAELAGIAGGLDEETFADACHLCYSVRSRVRSLYPQWLAPGQMYGETVVA